MRWRVWFDRLIVLVILLAAWQGGSLWLGNYWLSSPWAVPAIFAGFRIAVPYAIGGAVIAELISSNRGLGYLVQTGAMNFDTTQVFVAILAATVIVHVFIAVIDVGERFLLRWRPRGAALIVDHGT